ncbi:Dip2/Utp12 family-domain-containing protein [Xylaria venustula]|nr:Dip2/Utp12 family-domain-containing protein [Xylaria venustula]
MSTKRKAPGKIAHPVVRQSAKKPLKPHVNESETAVSVAGALKADKSAEAVIEISSDADSSDYEVSDDEIDRTNDSAHDVLHQDTKPAAQKPIEAVLQKRNEGGSGSAGIIVADSSLPNDNESDQELAQPTLGELARAHGTIDVPSALTPQSDAVVAQGRTIAPQNHSSLGTVLSQALRTDDADLLESCLHVTDGNTIDSTIQRLDSTLASILLTKLASRMHRRPGRAGSLMTWVQSTLVCHGGALAAQPGLVKRLSELQRVLDERARSLNSLLALKGKLDLMNAQLKLRRQQGNSEVDENVRDEEGIIYVEGEESDADIVNGLMDLDDDELPVTNGVMDDDSEEDDLESNAPDNEEELDGEDELDEDEVNHDDVESEEDDSEVEAGPEPPSKRSKPSRSR